MKVKWKRCWTPGHFYAVSLAWSTNLFLFPSLFLLFVSEPDQLRCAPYSSRAGIWSVSVGFFGPFYFFFVSDSPCPRMEALIPAITLSTSHHGGRFFRPGWTHKKDCQLPVPFSLASLPGLDSLAVAKICEELNFYRDILQKIYFSGPWP